MATRGWLGMLLMVGAVGSGACPRLPKDEPPGDGRKGPGGPQPSFGATVTSAVTPRPLSGGTLLMLADGRTVVASDPDRDTVFVVQAGKSGSGAPYDRTLDLRFTIPLQTGDEPGRSAEDDLGHVHVVLRGGGGLATIDPDSGVVIERRAVCPAPRGIAFDVKKTRIHVACAGGELVTLGLSGETPIRTVMLDRDLRDVVVDGERLLVTHLRSAELIVVGADGRVVETASPSSFSNSRVRKGGVFTASVAWRARPAPFGGILVLHQRGLTGEVSTIEQGGYGGGGFDPCAAIVHGALSALYAPTLGSKTPPAIASSVVPVDFDVSRDGRLVAVLDAGNAHTTALRQVRVGWLRAMTDESMGPCSEPGTGGEGGAGGAGGSPDAGSGDSGGSGGSGGGGSGGGSGGGGTGGGMSPPASPTPHDPAYARQPTGETTSIVFGAENELWIQTREPATIQIPAWNKTVTLSDDSRADTGWAVFHSNAGGFIACASCHPEGGDDGRVWRFTKLGSRRTQSLRGGITGTEPFHWDGDMRDMTHLVGDVFSKRMSGPDLAGDQVTALTRFVDAIPPIPTAQGDALGIDRGRAIFSSAGCASCHSGPRFTRTVGADVGTGGQFQVPSLTGVAWRAPYLHNGCARTLTDRFGKCGGGNLHGHTSNLDTQQLADLVSFLETL